MTQILSEAARIAAWGQPCQLPGGELVEIDGRSYDVFPAFAEPWRAWETVRVHYGYSMPGSDTGHYNCRKIGGGTTSNRPWSEHAWRGMAFDMNWLQNPDGDKLITDMPPGMPEAIQKIKTHSGEYVFRWGGNWDRDPETPHTYYDAMHFSVVASPEDLESGVDWSTVEGANTMSFLTEEDQKRLKKLLDGIDAFNAENPDDKTSEYGQGKWASAVIRQHTRDHEEGGKWEHPHIEDRIGEHSADPDAHHE